MGTGVKAMPIIVPASSSSNKHPREVAVGVAAVAPIAVVLVAVVLAILIASLA